MSRLHEFTMAAARPMPVLILADVSGSMDKDGKIQTLNRAICDMIESFASEEADRAEIHVAVITFGGDSARMHLALTPATDARWADMSASGKTPMGSALSMATALLEDRAAVPSRAYRPTIIVVSDGRPTDEWKAPLEQLLNSQRASKAERFGMLIGAEDDEGVLQAFVGSEQPVIHASDARRMRQFFRLVTMSVTSRSRGPNPNSVSRLDPADLDDIDF
jgi:uncharacterized protein YegL